MSPLLHERLTTAARPGWTRTVHARRAVAAVLVLLAGVLALRGDPAAASTEVVVAARDLAPGQVITDDDLRTVSVGARTVPEGAVTAVDAVAGRTSAGAVRAGETLTDVRVVGPSLAALATGRSGATSVPVRLSDPDVADLLRPGDEVDVLVLGRSAGDVRVLAAGAVVLAVQPAHERRSGDGRLVVLGVGADQAATVATASLESAVTVTFR
ncbi:SAF domain-containing protein [Rhodococcus antarcticus]|uniref:SAF domain-containing protein n=1 Tax=Rhodococcus antarcticus TaxID=2987751 RepID=A0ABY6P662_9NOCA|nr:SAF domain-containing protein [Rhodococcus antarcticus]UZJ26668.1 SAF domain-containing protein [Rhodococcus antarcticus]